jgi:hypothetical protein
VRFWSGWGRAFGTNIQTSGWKTIGFSTMTTRPLNNSWLPKTLRWFPTPLFTWPHPLWLLPIAQDEITAETASFCHDCGDPRRITTGYWHSHLRTSRDAWNHRNHAGIAVYMPKGTTSKEMVETRSYSKKLFFYGQIPRIFG